MAAHDAVVVGSGPNGLAAAIVLARAGRSVLLREGGETVGGGMRSAELTLPGFMHDVCSAVHPLALSSPFFNTLSLADHGLEWVHSPACLAHPFDDGSAALLERSMDTTGESLDRRDADAWRDLMEPFVERWDALAAGVLGPLRVPRNPILMARFGLQAIRSAGTLARKTFDGPRARALFAGSAAHSVMALVQRPTAAFGLTLSVAGHAVGWPVPRGGTQGLANALAGYFRALGGEIVTGAPVADIAELDDARTILLDLTPRQVLRVAGHRLPAPYRAALGRYRYGAGAFKMDWALDEPIPWTAPECSRAITVHLGGELEELEAAETAAIEGEIPETPFVLLTQPTLFDPTRAPADRHTAWAYCHVPSGSTADMTERIEDQIERFAPGFRERILARSTMAPADLERHNPNLVGGDISGGTMDLGQLFFRPNLSLRPYATPVEGLYLCSASTPPGGGVHGMSGYYAARSALGRSMKAPRND